MKKTKKCADCGEDHLKLDVHHMDRNRENNHPSNLQLLCKRCHGKEHWHEGQVAKEVGFDAVHEMRGNYNYKGRLKDGFSSQYSDNDDIQGLPQ